MSKLLHIEWLKIRNYNTFWILSALFLLSVFGLNYIVYTFYTASVKKDALANALVGGPYDFPAVWQTVSWLSGFLLFVPGLLVIISMTNEYSFKTHRQNVIDGLSRTEFISTKLMVVLIVSLVCAITVFFNALGFGLAEGSPFSWNGLQFVFYFFIQALSYTGIALMFSVLFKRSGISIGVFFLYVVILDNMLAGLFGNYVYNDLAYFFPLRSVNNLIGFPAFKSMVKKMLNRPDVIYFEIAAAVYLAIYVFVSKRKFETDDL